MEKTNRNKQILTLVGLGGLVFLFKDKLFGVKTIPEQKIDMADDVENRIQKTKEELEALRQRFLNAIQQSEQITAQEVAKLLEQLENQRIILDQLYQQQKELATKLSTEKTIEIEKQFLEITAQLKEQKLKEAEILEKLHRAELEEAENKRLMELLELKINSLNQAFAQIEQTLAQIKQQSNIEVAQILEKEAQARQEALKLIQEAQQIEEKIQIAYEQAVKLATEYEKLDAEARQKLAEALLESQKQLAKQFEEEMYQLAERESQARLALAEQQTKLAEELYKKSIEYTKQVAEEASKARQQLAITLQQYAQQLADIEHEYATKLFEEGQKAMEQALKIEAEARQRLAEEVASHIQKIEEKNLEILSGLNALIQALPVSVQATITKQVPKTIINNYNYICDILAITDLIEDMANRDILHHIYYTETLTPQDIGVYYYICFADFNSVKDYTTQYMQQENTTLNDIYNLTDNTDIRKGEYKSQERKYIYFRALPSPNISILKNFKQKYLQFYPPIYDIWESFKALKEWLDIQLFIPLGLPTRLGNMNDLKIKTYIMAVPQPPEKKYVPNYVKDYILPIQPPNTEVINFNNRAVLFIADSITDFWTTYINLRTSGILSSRMPLYYYYGFYRLVLTTKDVVNFWLKNYGYTQYLI